jgi:hypothetical protein
MSDGVHDDTPASGELQLSEGEMRELGYRAVDERRSPSNVGQRVTARYALVLLDGPERRFCACENEDLLVVLCASLVGRSGACWLQW